MAVQPDTTSGTLTTTAGSINFTTSGTNLLTREHLPGDRFLVNGLELQIATITGENTGTLTEVCPPSAAVSGYPVRLRFQPDGARVAAQTRNLIDLIGNGTIQSLAELDGNADDLIGFLGPNTLRTFNRTDLIQGADYDIQVDTLAERATYDNRPENFSVLVSDVGDGRAAIYVKRSNEDGDWSNPAYVTGGVGPAPTIAAGTTTTVTPTTPANVSVVPNGSGGYTLNFSIPQGFQGVPGADGAQGPQGNGLQIDEVGPLSERSNYDNQPEGFTFFDTDGGNLYFRVGASGNWSDPIAFQGPPGTSGAIITTTNGVGNGTVGPYTLNAAPINSESVWVSISGVQQYDYVISGTNITFGVQVPTGVPWQVKTSGPLPVGVIPDGSITADKITNDPSEIQEIKDKLDFDINATEYWKTRLASDTTASQARAGLGAAASNNPTLTGSINIATNAQRVGITGNATPIPNPEALVHIRNENVVTCGFRDTSYWTGSASAPYQNNDGSLFEVYNTTTNTSLNRSWAGSFANAYHRIPAGVFDSGTRVGVIGWATSVNTAGYQHEGRLATQFGIHGTAGFQGPGSGTSAIIDLAVGVNGQVYSDSGGGARIRDARGGSFTSVYQGSVLEKNFGVFAAAIGGLENYAFYGAGGIVLNSESIVAATGAIPNGNSSNTAIGSVMNPNGNLFLARAGVDAKFSLQSFPGGDSSAILAAFLWNASVTGAISHTSTTTTYATSSDYRLEWKEGKVDLEGSGEFIDSLKPYYFPNAGKAGFIAHEFAEVSPVSVSGEKDAVAEDGNPIYQQMQASTDDVIANLVAELQSLRKRVAELEAKII